jgi:hypothetical protein
VTAVGSNNVSIYVAGEVMSLSDATAKRDVRCLEGGALERLCMLTGYTYEYEGRDDSSGCRSAGLLAQEVGRVLPEAVRMDHDSRLLSVSYAGMMALVVESIKDINRALRARGFDL